MADSTSGVSMDAINSLIGASNSNRVSGLASGIDIDSIVAKMMLADSQPLFQMQQQLQKMEWERDDYRSMNTLLDKLKTTTTDMQKEAGILAKTTTSTDESVVTATAAANAGNATYQFSNVQKATAAYNTSTDAITSNDGNLKGDTKLSESGLDLHLNEEGKIDFTITTYDENGDAIKDDGKYDPDHKDQAGYHFIFDKDTSIDEIMSAISSSGVGVSAFYDESTGKVSLTRTEAGDFNKDSADEDGNRVVKPEIEISGDSNKFLTDTLKLSGEEQNGTAASFTLNGLSMTRPTNTFTLNGTTFTINGDSQTAGTTEVAVKNDVDTMYKTISDFVDQYNDVINQINEKVNEKPNRDYAPLTDVQKQDMKDTDIENWTDKAKAGMLFSDSILQGGLTQMRQDLYSPVDGTSDSDMDQLAEIGITTSDDVDDNGKLVIDEAKLKEALSTNPQAVVDLFAKNGTDADGDGKSDFTTTGLMERLTDTVNDTITKIEQKAGNDTMNENSYYMGNDIKDLNDRITSYKEHLQDVEDQYYTQFTAMEEAIEEANQQAAYIQGFTGS
ncbi:MAG: flagellar filament capping protein FliD [Sporolactobacillus sp.]|jgi:flagellar hook-associated protein 2|nr:flagellar filament capping protein FliD [Sporolactobacillus sp.]